MTDGRGDFRAYLLAAATGVLERFREELRPEIYALSFRIWRVDDDDRRPYVAIGYNTESRYEAERRPEDPGEARCNYACRLLGGFEMLGNCPEDPAGGALYAEEVRRLGLWFDGDGDAAELDATREPLRLHFADACVRPARDLHDGGLIGRVLGRPLPVWVFDMYCPGWEIEATQAANPPELVEEFLAWQRAAEEAQPLGAG
ncbi:hypothetical protein [Streptomyces sp. GbtcB6]|uniref:hypothetical protein n=1 Tax=Streptomyces sp. GbtcB6 TaxID=2824751 RepID=UPI001C3004F1|nr:hypothetical protein [Streptomyces sp. GbtcB6]